MGGNTSTLELLTVCFYLLIVSRIILGHNTGVIVVNEDGVVCLPCSPIPKENLEPKLFVWTKDDQKAVFWYIAGHHSNNGFRGQDAEFQGRVSHYPEGLENGNASIKIQNVKLEDRGIYTCDFPHFNPSQKFHLMLVVNPNLRDRSSETPGASPKPHVSILETTADGTLLQCEAQGASPKPRVEWWDSAGNILPAEGRVTEREGRDDILLLTTVMKTGAFSCVVTQEDIGHRIAAETFVSLNEKMCEESRRLIISVLSAVIILLAVLAAVLGCLLLRKPSQQSIKVCGRRDKILRRMLSTRSPQHSGDPPLIKCEPKPEAV